MKNVFSSRCLAHRYQPFHLTTFLLHSPSRFFHVYVSRKGFLFLEFCVYRVKIISKMASEYFFPRSFFPSHIFALSFCTLFCFGGPHEGGFECACSNRNPLFVSIILAASFFIVTPFLCSATEYRWWIFFFSFFQILPAFCRELVFYSNISIVFLVFFFCNFFCFGILQLARCVSVFYPVL